MDRFSPRASAVAWLVALFAARVLAAVALIPPWQGPDEPAHFVLAELMTVPEGARAAARIGFEREVLQSMTRHGWWRFYQEPTPAPLPTAFAEVPEHLASGTLLQPAYYMLAAAVLQLAPSRTVIGDYRLLSALSIVLSVAALLCGWAGTTLLFGPLAGVGASAIAALHPQFLITALTVGPDPLINLCGAFMWWQGARLVQTGGWQWFLSALCMLLAAFVAVLSKRNGIPLAAIALLAIAMCLLIRSSRRSIVMAVGSSVVLIAIAVVVYIFVSNRAQISGVPARLLTFWTDILVVRRPSSDFTMPDVIGFLKQALDSSWLVAGWLRFPAPAGWYTVAYVITIGGLLGTLLCTKESANERRWLWLPWLFVGVQGAALLGVTFAVDSVPQGRYFFAVAMPMCALLWVGLNSWSPPRLRVHAPLGILAVIAILDVTAFALVLVRAYL